MLGDNRQQSGEAGEVGLGPSQTAEKTKQKAAMADGHREAPNRSGSVYSQHGSPAPGRLRAPARGAGTAAGAARCEAQEAPLAAALPDTTSGRAHTWGAGDPAQTP